MCIIVSSFLWNKQTVGKDLYAIHTENIIFAPHTPKLVQMYLLLANKLRQNFIIHVASKSVNEKLKAPNSVRSYYPISSVIRLIEISRNKRRNSRKNDRNTEPIVVNHLKRNEILLKWSAIKYVSGIVIFSKIDELIARASWSYEWSFWMS